MRRGPASGVRELTRRIEQLSTLRDDERHVVGRIAALERVLDFDRVAAHVRSAVGAAALVADPVPHLVVQMLLPSDVYRAVVEAIPSSVFFEERAPHAQGLRVPPRLAPTLSIVTWTFVTEIVRRALAPALLAHFEGPLAAYARTRFPSLPPFGQWDAEISLTEGRIVRRGPGVVSGSDPERTWDLLASEVYLAGGADGGERANSLLTVLGSADAHTYASITRSGPNETERYTYEFGIGPTRDARRALTKLMEKST